MLEVIFVLTYITALVATAFALGGETLLAKMPVAFFTHIALLCMIAGISSLAGIPARLETATICNVFLVAVIAWFCRTHHVSINAQTVADKSDAAAYLAIGFTVILCAYMQFGPTLVPHFQTVDAATHCREAIAIAETGHVSAMFFTRYFDALWMLVCTPFIDPFYYYQVFVVAETALLAFGGLAFYSVVKNVHRPAAIATVVCMSIVYLIGYPLNNNAFGFSYLGAGVSIIGTIIWVVEHGRDFAKPAICYIALSLNLFGLIICYALFVSFVYLAVFIALALQLRKNGTDFKWIIAIECGVFAIPVVLGFAIVYLGIFSETLSVTDAIAIDGGAYKSLFSNFVFILPASIYGIVACIKDREADRFLLILGALTLLASLTLFALSVLNRASPYYFYKVHYVLWLMLFAFATRGLTALFEANKAIMLAYSCTWLIVLGLAVSGIDGALSARKPQINPSAASRDYFDIIMSNRDFLRGTIVTEDEVQLYKEYDQALTESGADDAFVIAHIDSTNWFQTITGRTVMDAGYWSLSDSEIRKKASASDCILVVSTEYSRLCPLTTQDGTEAGDLIDEYLQLGTPLYANSAGAIIETSSTN